MFWQNFEQKTPKNFKNEGLKSSCYLWNVFFKNLDFSLMLKRFNSFFCERFSKKKHKKQTVDFKVGNYVFCCEFNWKVIIFVMYFHPIVAFVTRNITFSIFRKKILGDFQSRFWRFSIFFLKKIKFCKICPFWRILHVYVDLIKINLVYWKNWTSCRP